MSNGIDVADKLFPSSQETVKSHVRRTIPDQAHEADTPARTHAVAISAPARRRSSTMSRAGERLDRLIAAEQDERRRLARHFCTTVPVQQLSGIALMLDARGAR